MASLTRLRLGLTNPGRNTHRPSPTESKTAVPASGSKVRGPLRPWAREVPVLKWFRRVRLSPSGTVTSEFKD